MEEQGRNHPREQTTAAAEEALLPQRGILDISITIFKETLHIPFLIEKGGKTCFRDQALNLQK